MLKSDCESAEASSLMFSITSLQLSLKKMKMKCYNATAVSLEQ